MSDAQADEFSYARRLREENAALVSSVEALKNGGPGGTSGGMDSVDAKIAAAEARTDTKFAELRGDLAKFATKETVWAAVGTLGGIILAVLLAVAAFGGDRFDAGMSVSGTIDTIVKEQRQRDAAQDKKLDEILRRLPHERENSTPSK